jgi:DNA-binding beta-propeller fold protein YncE
MVNCSQLLRATGVASTAVLLISMSGCGNNGGQGRFSSFSGTSSSCSSCSLSSKRNVSEAGSSSLPFQPTGGAKLVSYESLPTSENGVLCSWEPASLKYASLDVTLYERELTSGEPESSSALGVAQDADTGTASSSTASPTDFPERKPVRTIRDPYSDYSAVAVDPTHNEVVLTDENLFNLLVYDRTTNTPPNEKSEPIRRVGGRKSELVLECGVYVDPKSGDVYAVDNDTEDEITVFSPEARGNVAPDRKIRTPHGAFGIVVDEDHQELLLSVEHDSAVVSYKKSAGKDDSPIRLLQGDNTQLADPHGMALDTKDDLFFVVNHGSQHAVRPPGESNNYGTRIHGTYGNKANWPLTRDDAVLGSGKNLPASITVYKRDASGNTAPLRVISGPNTLLDWPSGITFDPKTNELFVANDMGNDVLVFSATAAGDVPPVRAIKGPKSLIKNPTGVAYDATNDELWVANFGDHTATVFKPSANGDVAPLRVIRSAPANEPSLQIGRPSDVAYDTKRDQLLVPN